MGQEKGKKKKAASSKKKATGYLGNVFTIEETATTSPPQAPRKKQKAPLPQPQLPPPPGETGVPQGDDHSALLSDALLRCAQHLRLHDGTKASQAVVLRLIGQGDITQKELVQLVGVRPASLSEILGKLERAGWITKAPVPGDKRSLLLSLTPQGQQQLSQLSPPPSFSILSPQDQAHLLSLLTLLLTHWHSSGGGEPPLVIRGAVRGPHRDSGETKD